MTFDLNLHRAACGNDDCTLCHPVATSSYLNRPLRTIDQALADAEAKLVKALRKLPQTSEVDTTSTTPGLTRYGRD